ncbi:methylenetetrahydrofolate reductase [uncultured Corynebacterium sp.]|uniref:methylenetetrahydrofolate reductase n=1 Tax=uncultured Corynebacterium sp. TaxID=159447 RepID=UPI00259BA05C|nr:methylenetetrahydrofolate reductase [uncultured Corynebacterium sp.]
MSQVRQATLETRISASAPLDGSEEELAPRTQRARTALSFEVIPPRHSADSAKLDALIQGLAAYQPDYVSVTSSHRSDWLEGTARLIERIAQTTSMRPIAHLACTAGTPDELRQWITQLIDAGVRGFLALRGDIPAGLDRLPDTHLQHATDLLNLIQDVADAQAYRLAAGKLALSVACYPRGHAESTSDDQDLDVLLAKQRLGADFAITQLFFDAQDYLSFAERARLAGVRIPLIPGIMPMTSVNRVRRMGELSGVAPPVDVIKQLEAARTPEEEHQIGMRLTVALARTILQAGAGGLHVYTHNDLAVTRELLKGLNL